MATISSVNKVWPQLAITTPLPEYSRLVDYYDAAWNAAGGPAHTALYATRDVDSTLDLLSKMRLLVTPNLTLNQMTRRRLVDALKNNPGPNWVRNDDASVLNSLCFALSLWLTLEIVPAGTMASGRRTIDWADTSTVSAMLSNTFTQPAAAPASEQIDTRLTLEYLESYHNFKFLFTDNLAEHLDLVTGPHSKPALVVYKHKVFLWNELRHTHVSPLPRDLMEETLDTLNLLLPHGEHRTQKFLQDRGMIDVDGLGICDRTIPRDLNLGNYKYWHGKVAKLSALVAKGPTGIRQLKPGRGSGANFREFINFWVAVVVLAFLTIGFGTASVVLAVLQYSLGKVQYDIAVVQYKLSLAQACATMKAELPEFCPG